MPSRHQFRSAYPQTGSQKVGNKHVSVNNQKGMGSLNVKVEKKEVTKHGAVLLSF